VGLNMVFIVCGRDRKLRGVGRETDVVVGAKQGCASGLLCVMELIKRLVDRSLERGALRKPNAAEIVPQKRIEDSIQLWPRLGSGCTAIADPSLNNTTNAHSHAPNQTFPKDFSTFLACVGLHTSIDHLEVSEACPAEARPLPPS